MMPNVNKNSGDSSSNMKVLGDGRTIRVSKVGNSYLVSGVSGSRGRRGGSSDYYGPWAVVQKNATTVTVKALDAANGYLSKSLYVAGLTTKELTTDTDVTITASGIVCLEVTESGGTYAFTFSNVANLPAQTAGHYYKELAAVTFASSAITALSQTVHDQIETPGRIV